MPTQWSEHFEQTKGYPASKLLEISIPLCGERQEALDLGAGALRDTKFLLSTGFKKVTVIDIDPTVKKYADKIPPSLLNFQIKPFEKIKLKANHFDLINAQFSLPFTKPPHLPGLIEQIKSALQPGGIFCGNFFGPKDDWAKKPEMSFTSKTKIKQLLKGLKILYLNERKFSGRTADGNAKNWHLIEIIAQQKTL